jgi:hypothetical protein
LEEVEELVVETYKEMHRKYFREKSFIQRGNLVEVRYEDFIDHPLRWLEYIYSELGLDGFEESVEVFKQYVVSQRDVKTRGYHVSEDFRQRLAGELAPIFHGLGYKS